MKRGVIGCWERVEINGGGRLIVNLKRVGGVAELALEPTATAVGASCIHFRDQLAGRVSPVW